MRILYITRAAKRGNLGGLELLSSSLSRELAHMPDTSVEVVAHRGSRATAPFFTLTCLPGALKLCRHSDIIFLGDPLLSFAGWLLHRLHRKPVAVIVHGLDITFKNPLYQAYLWLFFRSFQLYLPISHHVNKLLGQLSVKGNRQVITPGIHDRFFAPNIHRSDLLNILPPTPYPLQPNDIFLLTVGRLVPRKGHAWFIACVLPHLPSRVHYVIAGTGPALPDIRRAAASQNLTSRVHLLGRVTDERLRILYNTADAFIQPNIYVPDDVEGFGLVLLEAALCNRPVLAADIDGIPDAVHSGRNGLLVPAGDAMAWISALNHLATGNLELPHNPRRHTQDTFCWDKTAARYRAALAKTISPSIIFHAT